jgi:hypothetical protein
MDLQTLVHTLEHTFNPDNAARHAAEAQLKLVSARGVARVLPPFPCL